jgi:hypothetical protein
MTERVKKAIDIFLDAINQGNLAKGECTACAVGNLVAHGMGCSNLDEDNKTMLGVGSWGFAFITDENNNQHVYPTVFQNSDIVKCVEATHFTIQELIQIEYAFETSTSIYIDEYIHHSKEEIRVDQIKGLAAVIKVMLGFEEDMTTKVEKVFTEKAMTIPL